jgi:hypothetical protein
MRKPRIKGQKNQQKTPANNTKYRPPSSKTKTRHPILTKKKKPHEGPGKQPSEARFQCRNKGHAHNVENGDTGGWTVSAGKQLFPHVQSQIPNSLPTEDPIPMFPLED